VFLTLTGEAPRWGDGWKPVSYSVLHKALSAQPASRDPYVADLCHALARLVAVADAARTDQEVAAVAFKDDDALPATGITSYVEEMRLNKVVQRIWVAELAAKLGVAHPWQVLIAETRGQALMNVQAMLLDNPGYLVGLQLQWRTLKAFCQPYPYPTTASEDQRRNVEAILKKIRIELDLDDGVRPSPPRARGFRSFSVATLPVGRKLDDWIATVRPQLNRLYRAFPAMQPVTTNEVPIDDDSD
jgi:hypothetical protein